jgi:Calx-beta domain
MGWKLRAAWLASLALGGATILLFIAAGGASASSGLSYHWPAPPVASAGSLGPGKSVTFIVRVQLNGVADPNGPIYISYFKNHHVTGDSTAVPPAQCGGTSQVPADGSPLLCSGDSQGKLALTYTAPGQPPAQGVTDWLAASTATGGVPNSLDHYVYTTVYRFASSPIARSGSLAAGAVVPVNLTAEDGLNHGIPGSTVYLSFKRAVGGGSAAVGSNALTSAPALFLVDSSGALQINYSTPASLPSAGQDAIVVQDLAKSAKEKNSDSYAFLASAPVVSVGDVTVVEGDDNPTVPAQFTVTISPVQANPVTLQYKTLCGIGDKGCGEDFVQVFSPVTITIPANARSTFINVPQFSYIGAHGGETFNEGWYVLISNPSVGILGRTVGNGMLLPDVEGSSTALPYLYTGSAGVMPVTAGAMPLYFTVTLGAKLATAVTFNYSTSNGTAIAGTDYVSASNTVTIPAGKTSAVIWVTVLPNSPPATARSFTFTISSATGGATISGASGTGTILAG